MARKKTAIQTFERETLEAMEVVDLQIQISPRGRSVMNGTVLLKGKVQTFHRELQEDDIRAISSAALGVISPPNLS